MKKNYKYVIVITGIAVLFLQMFLTKEETQSFQSSKKIVSLSTFTLYDIAQHIAGDTLELVRIIPSGVDIHSYEPTPNIMAKVENSNLLIYNGAGLEPWLSSFNFNSKSVAIAKFIPLRHLNKVEHKSHEHHGHACSHSKFDPHFWLDIENMKRAARIITYEFIALKPRNKLLYLHNQDKYIAMLDRLDTAYKHKLKECKRDTIITNHNAFSYLSNKYGFDVSSLKGLSPDSEASPKDMIRIIDEINKHKAHIIFFENFSSNKSMDVLSKQANVKVDSLHTLGNNTKKDVEAKHTYKDIMLHNLNKINKALVCQ